MRLPAKCEVYIMNLLKEILNKTEKIDFVFPNNFEELMNNDYYDYDKFEWFLYYVFKLDGSKVDKIGKKGKGDGGADLILTIRQEDGSLRSIGIQAKYWKNRVGSEPINQLASAKSRHNLTDLWIITTSDLTTDAKEIAESMDIKILRAEDVSRLIESVKDRYNKDIEKKGESSIEFLKIVEKPSKQPKPKIEPKVEPIVEPKIESKSDAINESHFESLRVLRTELGKKYKLFPLYNVFNNDTLAQIIEQKPTTNEELMKINGLSSKKVEMFGAEVIDFVKSTLITKPQDSPNLEQGLIDLLITERPKIARFNKLTEVDVYDDKTASYIAKMKPKNKETLAKVYGFRKENIEIFGDHLLRVIAKYLEGK
jgi:restriction system protein